MTLVVPLGKSAFKFFDKDRDVIHTSAIAIKQALDLSFSIRLLPIASDFLLEGLTACRAIAGFDSLKHLGLRERLGLRDFTQQVEMIKEVRGTGRMREKNANLAWIQGGKCSWLTKRAPGFATKTEGGADVFYERRLLQ